MYNLFYKDFLNKYKSFSLIIKFFIYRKDYFSLILIIVHYLQ